MTYSLDTRWDQYVTLWAKNAAGQTAAVKETELIAAATATLPSGSFRLRKENGTIVVQAADGASSAASATVTGAQLLDALYQESLRVCFAHAVSYAVIRNVDPSSHASGIMLLRLSREGVYYSSFVTDAELRRTHWIVGVDTTLYGVKLEGDRLVFVAKPVETAVTRRPRAPRDTSARC
jgi:hypothetical protein